ncbi:hypothetical protein ABFX02_04G200900 [Erythranthe guttata]|nr:PREDICTED: uncharacterized protein LOC105958509 [Erythranthe guttata]|eukprot:XP_012837963.1 PREDICTED: uncharacterized protein LOC105958509 [Erythranthe guttata]
MEEERGLLNWVHFYPQEKSMDDEVRQSLVLEEELKLKDQEISHLKETIAAAIRERDEARDNCRRLLYEKILLQQHSVSIIEEEGDPAVRGIIGGVSSSDSDDSIVSSPPPQVEAETEFPAGLIINRPLPEKGKLLQAVMKAGPLLQTLLLAGPLPQWRHPPPPLDTYQIPPPPLSLRQDPPSSLLLHNSNDNVDSDYFINEFKYQRVVLQ